MRGFGSAAGGQGGLTEIQRLLFEAVTRALTGHRVDATAAATVTAREFAEGLARRNLAFRTRIVQIMVLGELVLSPIPEDVSERVAAFADELGVADDLVSVARSFALGSLGMAAVDFERNGYLDGTAQGAALHTSQALVQAWDAVSDDPGLAARWASLADVDEGTIGRGVHDFYLFETGYLAHGAGLFVPATGAGAGPALRRPRRHALNPGPLTPPVLLPRPPSNGGAGPDGGRERGKPGRGHLTR